jgi:MFS transporter, DHA2 family, methylenomycin A resistance protein
MTSSMVGVVVRPETTQRRFVLFTMCLGVLIAQVDTSVVNLALTPIGIDLQASVNALQWVVDAYNLVYASLLLTAGTLGDLYGRRRLFALGVAILTLGSLVCGAALLMPTCLAILAVTYTDPAERTHAIGIWASCYGVALALGPTLGGFLVNAAGWRSIFLIIVPVSGLALVMTLRFVPESKDPEGRRLDLPGQALAIVALGTLTFAAVEAPHWSARSVELCLAVAVVAGLLFLRVESRTEGALLPLEFLRRRGLSASMAVASLMTFGMYGMLFLVPLYLQQQRRASVIAAGLALLPLSLLYVIVSQHSGALTHRFGPRVAMTAGMGLMGAGLFLLSAVTAETSLYAVELDLAILGIGLGLNTGPVNAVAVASVPRSRSGTASGLLNTARMIGATLGVAVLGAVFAHGQAAPGAGFIDGLRAALIIGGAGEVLGALIALLAIRKDALSGSAPG